MTIALTITADTTLMPEVLKLAQEARAEASEPQPLALDGAMNAGVTLEDIKNGVEVLSVLFDAGAAAFVFLGALRDYLRDKGSNATISIGDASTGDTRGRLGSQTSDDEIRSLTEPPERDDR